MFPYSRHRSPDLTRSPVLHWLLLVALLTQLLGPVAMAAAASLQTETSAGESAPGANAATSERGIWTVSCAGKPMWLPFPSQGHTDSGTMAFADQAHRACLFCKNAGTDIALPTADFANSWLATPSLHTRAVSSTATYRSVRQLYHPRAPPGFLHD